MVRVAFQCTPSNKVRALAERAELTDLGTPCGDSASVEPQGVLVFTHPLERGLATWA